MFSFSSDPSDVADYSTHPLVVGEIPITLIETPPSTKSGDSNSDYITSANGEPPLEGITNDVIANASNGEIPTSSPPDYINAKVIVYAALSGMVSFLPDGTIHGCNHHFSLMLFGYSQDELLKKVSVIKLQYTAVCLCLQCTIHACG